MTSPKEWRGWLLQILAPVIAAALLGVVPTAVGIVVMKTDLDHVEERLHDHEQRGGHEALQREVDRLNVRMDSMQQTTDQRLLRIEQDIQDILSVQREILRTLPSDT